MFVASLFRAFVPFLPTHEQRIFSSKCTPNKIKDRKQDCTVQRQIAQIFLTEFPHISLSAPRILVHFALDPVNNEPFRSRGLRAESDQHTTVAEPHTSAMQSRLSFSRIAPSQAAEQNTLLASQASAQHVLRQAEQKRAALLKRRPGRPFWLNL